MSVAGPVVSTSKAAVRPVLHRPLDAIFNPKNVAVIGATENAGSVGRTVLWKLISSPFGGTVFLRTSASPVIQDSPDLVHLAVVCPPAASIPAIIGQCADAGVPGAITIS